MVGLVEGLIATSGGFRAVVASGYSLWLLGPIALLASLVVRLLWRAWKVPALIARHRDDTGGVPVVAGWLAYTLLALTGLYQLEVHALQAIMGATRATPVIVLATAAITVVAASLLVALCRPGASALAWILRQVDRRTHARLGRSLFTPNAVAAAMACIAVAIAAATWYLSIRPSLGHLEIGFAVYLAALLAIVIAVHRLWSRWLAAVALAGAILVSAGALGARYFYPDAILDTWGNTQLAGLTVNLLHDIAEIRRDLDLASATPEIQPDYEDPASRPDIIVIMVDTVRADRTPIYGGAIRMPSLMRLSQQSAVFDRAFAPSNNTRRSLPAILLGANPDRILGRVVGWSLALDPRHIPLGERMRAGGHETAGFFCCRGFYDPVNQSGWSRGFEHIEIHTQDRALADAGRRWIAERDGRRPREPLFAFFHFLEPHNWRVTYKATSQHKTLQKRYDQSLAVLDQDLTELLAMLASRERADRTIIVFASDHGEGLGDRGQAHHSSNLHDSQIRVPLLISGPDIPKRRIPDTVGLADLAPTLLELAGYVPPGMPAMDATSLVPLLRGPKSTAADPPEGSGASPPDRLGPGRAYSVMVADRSVPNSAWAIIAGRYKYIERSGNGPVQLFNLDEDPREARNIAEQEPGILARMRALMAERRAIAPIHPF